MDLLQLTENEMFRYETSMKNYMKQNNLSYFGIMYCALDNFTDIEECFLKNEDTSTILISYENSIKLNNYYNELKNILEYKVNHFFNKCINNEELKSYLKSFIFDVKFYANIFISYDNDLFENFVKQTENSFNTQSNLKLFLSNLNSYNAKYLLKLINSDIYR